MVLQERIVVCALAAVALPLFIVGCSGDDDDADPTAVATVETEGSGTAVGEPSSPTVEPGPPGVAIEEPPVTTVSAGGAEVEMGIGTYCWTTACVDKIGPVTRGKLQIASGDEVLVRVPDAAPVLNEVNVTAFPAADPQDLDDGSTAWRPDFDNSVTLPSERDEDEVRIDAALHRGTYVLSVGMFFEGADVQYGVVLEVQ
jgi:hypothetical protein